MYKSEHPEIKVNRYSIASAMQKILSDDGILRLHNLSLNELSKLKSGLLHLVELANHYGIHIKMDGLRYLQSNRCCVWYSGHSWSPTEEFGQFARAVESSTRNNRNDELTLKIEY